MKNKQQIIDRIIDIFAPEMSGTSPIDNKSLEENIIFLPLIVTEQTSDDIAERIAAMIEKQYAEKIRTFFLNNKKVFASELSTFYKKMSSRFYENSMIFESDDVKISAEYVRLNPTWIEVRAKLAKVEYGEDRDKKIKIGIKVLIHKVPSEEIIKIFHTDSYTQGIFYSLLRFIKGDRSIWATLFNSDVNSIKDSFTRIMGKSWVDRTKEARYGVCMLINNDIVEELKNSSVDIYKENEYKNLCTRMGLLDFIVLNESSKYFDYFNTENFNHIRYNIRKLLDYDSSSKNIKIDLQNIG